MVSKKSKLRILEQSMVQLNEQIYSVETQASIAVKIKNEKVIKLLSEQLELMGKTLDQYIELKKQVLQEPDDGATKE